MTTNPNQEPEVVDIALDATVNTSNNTSMDSSNDSAIAAAIAESGADAIEIIDSSTSSEENNNNNNNNTGGDGGDVLSLTAVPEYDQYPYSMAEEKFYFMASIKAPYVRAENRAPIDLVCVIDESGSMAGDRIRLVREAVVFIEKNLEANDRFAIVGFSNSSRVVMGLTKMDQIGQKKALQAINTIKATGGTAICDGLCRGINILRNRVPTENQQAISSVMLFTDGEASGKWGTAPAIIAAMSDPKWNLNTPMVKPKSTPVNNNNNTKSSPPVSGQAPPKEEVKESDGKPKQVGDSNEDEMMGNVLPCTVNTFGFGQGHNSTVLEAISEHGQGMYAFIKDTPMIADTFAECLGGLMSVNGQNLRIKMQPLNGVEIVKCLSQGFATRMVRGRKEMSVTITDIQSEESRDLVFELNMPAIAEERKIYPIVQFSVQYQNMIKDEQQVLSIVSNISRVSGNDIGERNIELDMQYNRLIAAEAMEKADEMAERGNLDPARRLLEKAQVTIQKSLTIKNEFCVNLVKDISKCSSMLKTVNTYRSHGKKMLKMNKKSHYMQRSVQSDVYTSQSMYQNRSKEIMKKKFKNKI